TREKIAGDIFAACRNRDVARLERCHPVGGDVCQNSRCSTKLQKGNGFTLGYSARELRLYIDDMGIREPTDQVDIVDRWINDNANVRHARRKGPDAGDADG